MQYLKVPLSGKMCRRKSCNEILLPPHNSQVRQVNNSDNCKVLTRCFYFAPHALRNLRLHYLASTRSDFLKLFILGIFQHFLSMQTGKQSMVLFIDSIVAMIW